MLRRVLELPGQDALARDICGFRVRSFFFQEIRERRTDVLALLLAHDIHSAFRFSSLAPAMLLRMTAVWFEFVSTFDRNAATPFNAHPPCSLREDHCLFRC